MGTFIIHVVAIYANLYDLCGTISVNLYDLCGAISVNLYDLCGAICLNLHDLCDNYLFSCAEVKHDLCMHLPSMPNMLYDNEDLFVCTRRK